MKIISRKIVSAFLAFSLSALAFSFETGGSLSNNTKFAGNKMDDLKLDQKNSAILWFRSPLTQDGAASFTAQGSFLTDFDDSVSESSDKLILKADLDVFQFNLKKQFDSSSLDFTAGRFFNTDFTGLVFSQAMDGAKVSYNGGLYTVSAYGAFTGLLNRKVITILDSEVPESVDSKEPYALAKKYILAGANFTLPAIFANQTLALEGIGAFRLESQSYTRAYGSLSLSGPIVSSVFYKLSSTVGFATRYNTKARKAETTDDDDETSIGNLSKASITYYSTFKSLSLSANGIYASGKQGPFHAFQGFTSQTAVNSIESPEYSGIIKAGLGATIKPVKSLLVKASGDFVFNAKKDIEYAGIQYEGVIDWQIVSDLSIGANFGQYFDNDNSDNNKTTIQLRAVITF